MQQVRSKQKQSTFKWAMALRSHYCVKWMQSLMNTPYVPTDPVYVTFTHVSIMIADMENDISLKTLTSQCKQWQC